MQKRQTQYIVRASMRRKELVARYTADCEPWKKFTLLKSLLSSFSLTLTSIIKKLHYPLKPVSVKWKLQTGESGEWAPLNTSESAALYVLTRIRSRPDVDLLSPQSRNHYQIHSSACSPPLFPGPKAFGQVVALETVRCSAMGPTKRGLEISSTTDYHASYVPVKYANILLTYLHFIL